MRLRHAITREVSAKMGIKRFKDAPMLLLLPLLSLSFPAPPLLMNSIIVT